MKAPPWRASDMQAAKRGFTLIEVLVVVAVAGILIGIALLSLGLIGDDRGLQRQALQLSSLIEMASDEAQLQGRDYGLELLQSGFRFVEYDPYLEVWGEVFGDELLRPRDLGEDMQLELTLEGHQVLLQAEAKHTQAPEDATSRDLTDDYLPHILIMASGDITPFHLQLIRQTDQLMIGLELKVGGELEIIGNDQEL